MKPLNGFKDTVQFDEKHKGDWTLMGNLHLKRFSKMINVISIPYWR